MPEGTALLKQSSGLIVLCLTRCLTELSMQVPIHLPLLCKWAQAVPYHQAAVLGHRTPGMCTPALKGVLIALYLLIDICTKQKLSSSTASMHSIKNLSSLPNVRIPGMH